MIECDEDERAFLEDKKIGPMTYIRGAEKYLKDFNVVQILKTMWSTLLVARPDDPVQFSLDLVEFLKTKNREKIKWEDYTNDFHRSNSPIKKEIYKECHRAENKDRTPPQTPLFDFRSGQFTRPVDLHNMAGVPQAPEYDFNAYGQVVKSASEVSALEHVDDPYFELTFLFNDQAELQLEETNSNASSVFTT